MNKTPYELSAVWIHSGVATTGHYWAYLRDFKNNKWRKFNDVFVSDVDEKTVFEDAIGGSSSGVSAYFLVRRKMLCLRVC
jgi:ubiquitin carboxyl-terminal hydrolase 25/28